MKEPFIDYGGGGIPSNGLDALTAEEMRDWLRHSFFSLNPSYRIGIVEAGSPLDWSFQAFNHYNKTSRACFLDAFILLLREAPNNNAWEIAQQKNQPSPFVQLTSKFGTAIKETDLSDYEKEQLHCALVTLLEVSSIEVETQLRAMSLLEEFGFTLKDEYVQELYEVSSQKDPKFALYVFSHLAKTDIVRAFAFLDAQPNMVIGSDFMVQYLPFRLVRTDQEAVQRGLDLLRQHHPDSEIALEGLERNYLDKLSKIKR